MPAALAIHRLHARTPPGAQPVAARLALQALGADLEDAVPSGLPPQALLWLRRLQLQAPEAALQRPAPVAWRQQWIAAGRERLDAALAQAARPARGPVPDSAPAVLFADTAEMLACLVLAAQSGQLNRWWWRGLLGKAWPRWTAAWAAHPQAQAGAQRLLARLGQGGVVAREGADVACPPAPATARPVAAAGRWGAGTTPAAAPQPVAPTERAVPGATAAPLPARDAAATPSGALPRAQGARPAPPASPSAGPSDAAPGPSPAGGPAAAVAAAGLEPARPPLPRRTARLPDAVVPVEGVEPPAPVSAVPTAPPTLPARPPQPGTRRGRAASGRPPMAPAETPARYAGLQPPAATAPAAAPPGAGVARDRSPPVVAAGADRSAKAGGAAGPVPRPEPPIASEAPLPLPLDRAEDAADPWPWPQAVPSRLAPLLFVVNALLEDGLYPDFTRPRDPGWPVPLWALLSALAHAWRLPDGDPLLDLLDQRSPDWVAPEVLPAAPGVMAGPWPEWLAALARTLRRRLCRRLGRRAADWPRALTLAQSARLWVSEAEWVAELDLATHDVAWRLAGLDRDPGWLPSVGCTLRFRFIV